jgi:hypothetical protein
MSNGRACEREPKVRLATKLAEIRNALISAGFDTTAEQAAVLGLSRSTAWAFFNQDKRAGPSAKVVKRALSSTKIPPSVRRTIEGYVQEKSLGLYGRGKEPSRSFRLALQLPIGEVRSGLPVREADMDPPIDAVRRQNFWNS